MTTAPTTLEEALESRSAALFWALELTLYDAEADTVETRYLSTLDLTLRPTDTIAPGRRYEGRMSHPRLRWSLVQGTTVEGASAADAAQLTWVDITGRDADIKARELSAADRPQVLLLGHPDLDRSQWLELHFTGRKLQPTADFGWLLDLRSLDQVLDLALSRPELMGLGGCLHLDGQHHLAIAAAGGLAPQAALVVSAMVRTTASGQQMVIAAKAGLGATTDWALWINSDDRVRWWIREDGQASPTVLASPEVVTDGATHRVCGVWTGTEQQLWIDGVQVAAQPFTGPPQSTLTAGVTVGGDGFGRHFVGEVDDVRIWIQDIPTAEQLSTWAMRQLPKEEHRRPRVYLRMEEGALDEAFDDSLHGHGAVITGPDPESLWSSMLEGTDEQRGHLRPLGLGTERRVPGVQVGPRTWQLSHTGCHGIGPVDEGAFLLRPQRSWTATDISIEAGAGGLSPSVPVDFIRTAGLVDWAGLVRSQHIEVTTPTQSAVVRILRHVLPEDPYEIAIQGGILAPEAAGGAVTIQTVGYAASSTDVVISPSAKTITTAGGMRFIGQLAGDTFALTSPGNSGTYTLAEDATALQLKVVEELREAEGPGPVVSIAFEDPSEYTVDLEAGAATLEGSPSLPLAFAFRGLRSAGDTRAGLMRALAEMGGMEPSQIDGAAWGALEAEDPHPCGIWLGAEGKPETVREVMDTLSHGLSWGTDLRTGLLTVARRSLDGEPTIELVYPRDFVSLEAGPTVPPIKGQRVTFAENRVPLEGDQVAPLARDIPADADLVRAAQQTHRVADAVVDEFQASRHPLAESPAELPSRLQTEAGAQLAAQLLYDLDAPGRTVWQGVLPLGPLLLEDWRRSLPRITSPFHAGLEEGRKTLPLSIEIDAAAHLITVFFWG